MQLHAACAHVNGVQSYFLATEYWPITPTAAAAEEEAEGTPAAEVLLAPPPAPSESSEPESTISEWGFLGRGADSTVLDAGAADAAAPALW